MDPLTVAAGLAIGAAAVWLAVTVLEWLADFVAAPNWRKLLHASGSVALCGWFAYWVRDSCWSIPTDGRLGIDGRIYYRAAQAWLDGHDPWLAGVPVSGFRFDFAGPPPTVLAFAPFAVLPEDVFNAVWLTITVAAAVYTIHRLRRPMWWLLFPPLVQGVLVGNPQVLCLAVLLAGSDWLRSLAVPLKAYAALPMLAERRWRALPSWAWPPRCRLRCGPASGSPTSGSSARSRGASPPSPSAGSPPRGTRPSSWSLPPRSESWP